MGLDITTNNVKGKEIIQNSNNNVSQHSLTHDIAGTTFSDSTGYTDIPIEYTVAHDLKKTKQCIAKVNPNAYNRALNLTIQGDYPLLL